MNRSISFLVAFVIVFSSIFIFPNYTFAEKGEEDIPLLTFVNRNDGFGIFTNNVETDMYNEVEVNDAFFEPGLVSIGDRISIELPNSSRYTAVIDKVDVDINGVYTVRGHLDNREYSYFLISSKDNKSIGLIYIVEDGVRYSINYDSERGIHYIFNDTQDDMDLIPSDPLIPPMENIDTLNDEGDLIPLAMKDLDELVTIDLMIVYTPAAVEKAQQMGGIDNVIAQAMGNSQLVLDNSQVSINLRLVHSQMIEYTESRDASLDLNRITNPSDGYMDEVHQWRDTYGADLVALVGDIEFNGGIGWLLGTESGRPDIAFTVNSINVISWSYTLVHEIGHNMGAHHSRNQYSSPAPAQGGLFRYSTGWRWTGVSGISYASVMTYNEGSRTAPIFSSPDILWDGVSTGSYSGYYAPADNARSLREIKHVVANYRNKKVVNIPVKSITLDKTNLYLLTNMIEKLTVTVEPYVSNHDLVWSSSNNSVAKVDGNGNITGLSRGTAVITVSTKNGAKSASCRVSVEEDTEIIFPDASLEEKVRYYLDKYEGPILRSDVLYIDDMYLGGSGITSIEGLQYFTNLSYLNVDSNSIEDITPLTNLTKLKSLDISNNQIQDIDALRGLINLKTLSLRDNSITDIIHLKDMTELESLDLSNNSIINIEALENMGKLSNGYFSNNKIKDLSPVKIIHDYSYFDFSSNDIYDISPLVINSNYFEPYYGPTINLSNNFLDIREGSKNMKDIQTLIAKGYSIYYVWQRQPIAVTGVMLNKEKLELEVGEEDSLNVIILPYNATNQDVIWTSSDSNVVKIDNKGNITAISPGKATIKVTTVDGAKTASCEVIVVKGYDVWKDILTTEFPSYTWIVKLNMPVDKDTVNSSTVYIMDQNYNRLNFINVRAENDEQFGYIKLNNDGTFENDKKYWIIIEDTIKSFNDIRLKKGLKIEFIVQP